MENDDMWTSDNGNKTSEAIQKHVLTLAYDIYKGFILDIATCGHGAHIFSLVTT
jgi:hypothetical protein